MGGAQNGKVERKKIISGGWDVIALWLRHAWRRRHGSRNREGRGFGQVWLSNQEIRQVGTSCHHSKLFSPPSPVAWEIGHCVNAKCRIDLWPNEKAARRG